MTEFVKISESGIITYIGVPDSKEAEEISAKYVEFYSRHIGRKIYGILCDEDGRLRNRPITAVWPDGTPAFWGDILVGSLTAVGEFGTLRAGDLFNISNRIISIEINGQMRNVLRVGE